MRAIAAFLILAACATAHAGTAFDITVTMTIEKAELCILAGRGSSGHCQDFYAWNNYVFKDDETVWTKYNFKNGNINDANIKTVNKMLRLNLEALLLFNK